MKYKELIKKQKEIDTEIFICPKCGTKEVWELYRKWGCEKDFENTLKRKTELTN